MSELQKKLEEKISETELVQLTADMIQIPSYAGIEHQETGVARYIKSVFDKEGIPCWLEEVRDGRCNVIAELAGTGGGKTILFNGHIDTVEPNDMENALKPYVEDGKLYGRGASDMKGPIAAMMGAMIAIKRANIALPGTILFTGVLDEEHNSIGTIDLLEKGLKADGAIVGEPSELQVCIAHRGLEWYEFEFIGKTVHGGSQSEGINAISKAVKFINALEEDLMPRIFARKHPLLKEATVNYGVIHGGTQLSTVAGHCSLFVDRRFLPSESYEEVGKEFQALIDRLVVSDPDFHCIMRVTDESAMKEGYVHGAMELPEDHPLVEIVQRITSEVVGEQVSKTLFPAWTDGALLMNYANIPTVVMGPGYISACHSKDEHILIDHLLKGTLSYAKIAIEFCSH